MGLDSFPEGPGGAQPDCSIFCIMVCSLFGDAFGCAVFFELCVASYFVVK